MRNLQSYMPQDIMCQASAFQKSRIFLTASELIVRAQDMT